MGFRYDIYNNLKEPKLILANPQKKTVGSIIGAERLTLTKNFLNMYELEFIIYEKINGEYTENYNKIEKPRLIEVHGIGWFQILTSPEKQDENTLQIYKEVKCCQLENILVYRKIHNINGTFGLYDVADQDHSLLHIISAECGWSIGHVDSELLSLYRTFDIDSTQIYNFLTTDISESFHCVFKFDGYSKSISAYKLENLGTKTNIIVSRKNILKDWIKDDSSNQIVTKLRVIGGDNGVGGNVDIREVNFGSDSLINLDYFLNEEWMSHELIASWNNYISAQNSINTLYSSTINLLKIKQNELLLLNNSLKELQSQQLSQKNVMGSSVESFTPSRVPLPSDSNYTIYQNASSLYNTYTSQAHGKKNEIAAKEAEIASINNTLSGINNDLDLNNYFTSEQRRELDAFITEDKDYEDNTFIITDTMSQSEIIDMKLELKQNGINELARISRPQYTITINASNLFTIQDNCDSSISYIEWRDQFEVGNIINIRLRDNYTIEARLMSMSISFDNLEDIELTFSNKNRLEDSLIELGEIIANANRTASSYDLNKYGYNSASKITSEIREFMGSTFKATLNEMSSNEKQEILIDSYGLHGRKWLDNYGNYDPRQMWLNSNTLLFSDDGFKTARTGIGMFVDQGGNSYYGILADVVVGHLIIGEKLKLSGSGASLDLSANNSITGLSAKITADVGGLRTEFTNYKGTVNNSLSTLESKLTQTAEVFSTQLTQYQQSVNGQMSTMQSSITQNAQAIATKVSSTDYNGNTLVSMINQSAAKISMSALNLDLSGYVTFTSLSTPGQTTIDGRNLKTGTVIADTIKAGYIYTGSISADQIIGGTIQGVKFNSSDSYGKITIEGAYIQSWNSAGQNKLNIDYNGNITSNNLACITLNGRPPITRDNYTELEYPPMSHTHSGYAAYNHNHSGVYADSFHRQSSYTIIPELTASKNISLYGSPNAASTWWCEDTFQTKSSSDFRLKKNILTLDLPDELFMALKPKSFEYKCDEYSKRLVFGLLSQQVESAFKQYGYDPYIYNLIELVNPKSAYTDECLYVDDKVHRLNYNNLIPWNISMTQKLYNAVALLKGTMQKQQTLIDSQADKINEFEQRLNKLEVP